ncbi:MAG: hypothetical protein QOG49_1391 [Frankiaceae bacterium]|nr:hypothetical protein [Frankiaceae bacterium]
MVKSVSETAPGLPRALPQAVLRGETDRTLLLEVIRRARITRAELAAATGFSKPTVSEAIRRLAAEGLVTLAGAQETGRRGRVGTFCELAPAAGWILAIVLDQTGVHTRSVDLAGRAVGESRFPPGAAGDAAALTTVLRQSVADAMTTAAAHGPLRAIGVSVANPVHPVTHEVIANPASPFPEGLFNPAAALADMVGVPVLVDNDVNLAALAEQRSGAAVDAASFAYFYIGEGMGLGLSIGGRLVRGAHGWAGEIGYLPGSNPRRTLAAELAASGFGRPDAPSADVDAMLDLLDSAGPVSRAKQRRVRTLTEAIVRVIGSVSAIVDPELVLLGGPVGTHPALLEPVRAALAESFDSPARLAHGSFGSLASLQGATHLALDHALAAAVAMLPNGYGAGSAQSIPALAT